MRYLPLSASHSVKDKGISYQTVWSTHASYFAEKGSAPIARSISIGPATFPRSDHGTRAPSPQSNVGVRMARAQCSRGWTLVCSNIHKSRRNMRTLLDGWQGSGIAFLLSLTRRLKSMPHMIGWYWEAAMSRQPSSQNRRCGQQGNDEVIGCNFTEQLWLYLLVLPFLVPKGVFEVRIRSSRSMSLVAKIPKQLGASQDVLLPTDDGLISRHGEDCFNMSLAIAIDCSDL